MRKIALIFAAFSEKLNFNSRIVYSDLTIIDYQKGQFLPKLLSLFEKLPDGKNNVLLRYNKMFLQQSKIFLQAWIYIFWNHESSPVSFLTTLPNWSKYGSILKEEIEIQVYFGQTSFYFFTYIVKGNKGPLKVLNGTKLILDGHVNNLDSSRISLESFRSFRGPLLHKPVTGQELFFSISYSISALESCCLIYILWLCKGYTLPDR